MTGPISVIGCGEMGRPIAARLLAAGLTVVACDTDPSRTAPLAALGARVEPSPAKAAHRSAIVLVVVSTEAQVRSVLDTIAPHRPPGQTIAVMSTIAPAAMRELSRQHPGMVDAPLSGGSARAETGQLTVMFGGTPADLDRLRTVLAPIARQILPCGPVGAGQSAKVLNNILCHANTVLMAEALSLGLSEGLDPEALRQVMEVSTGRNYLTEVPGAAKRLYAGYANNAPAFRAILSILRKDLGIARHLAQSHGQALPGLTALDDLLQGLGEETLATWARVGKA